MSCENLVCASCAGRVIEGRCAVCRASRLTLHSHEPVLQVLAAAVALMLLLLLVSLV